jgi:hypothetical protein
MQCNCGSDTDSVSLVRTALKARLEYLACKRCGRVSDATLYIRNTQVSVDQPGDPIAKNQFNSLTQDSAEQLYEIARALLVAFDEPALSGTDQPQQGTLF